VSDALDVASEKPSNGFNGFNVTRLSFESDQFLQSTKSCVLDKQTTSSRIYLLVANSSYLHVLEDHDTGSTPIWSEVSNL